MKIKNLTIDRKKWGRGNSGGYLLRDSDNKMCCLGFFSRECGFAPKDIRGLGLPKSIMGNMTHNDSYASGNMFTAKEVKTYLQKRGINLEGFEQINASLAGRLAGINDSHTTTDDHKEKKIIELFKKAGIKVKFIN